MRYIEKITVLKDQFDLKEIDYWKVRRGLVYLVLCLCYAAGLFAGYFLIK